MEKQTTKGHILALFTVVIWGTTFISTKVLLTAFHPVEILFFRFLIGLVALILICPHPLKGTNLKQELTFLLAGLCGICLYYLLENISLTLTLASNVGVIVSVAPFFTAILTHFFMQGEEKLRINFFIGFGIAMAGICLISFNGSRLQLNPLGDLLVVIAAFTWGCYSVLTRKISTFGYNMVQTTRRVFMYGIICLLPSLLFFDLDFNLSLLIQPRFLFNILFLGIAACALCFIAWSFAVKVLGAVKTSIYIYLVPVVAVVLSAVFLKEPITLLSAFGTALTLTGLVVSEYRGFGKHKQKLDL